MRTLFESLWRQDSGATAIEYGLLASMISVALFSALQKYYEALDGTYALVIANFTAH